MTNRCFLNPGCAVVLVAALVMGCSKSSPELSDSGNAAQSSAPNLHPPTPVVRFHWLGKKRLAAENSATNFMALWNKPESSKLEVQTLDKLSTAPWRLLGSATTLTNTPAALLRPLLDDLVQAESYIEVQGATNRPGELVLAIRLDAARAALWQTNLPAVLSTITDRRNFQISRSGDWTLLAISASGVQASGPGLLTDLQSRIQRDGKPFPDRATNYWLEAQVDAPRLSDAAQLGWKLPTGFPQLALTLTGDGQNVRTWGELNFDPPLPVQLEPWRVPLHLTAEPLTGLTVMRSATPLLERLGILSPELAQQLPEQFLLWLRSGPPLQIYFAYPTPDATNEFRKLAPPITAWVNSHTDPTHYGAIHLDTNMSELKWTGLSLCSPFLAVGSTNKIGYLYGGFGLPPTVKVRLPKELHDHVTQATNLVYFDWEYTAEALPQWRYLDDVSRMIFDAAHASRLRAAPDSIDWLLRNMTNLSHSVTEIRQANPHQLVLTRKSTLGLNSVELDILFNWINLPDFPRGLSSLWRTNPAPLVRLHLPNPAPAAPAN